MVNDNKNGTEKLKVDHKYSIFFKYNNGSTQTYTKLKIYNHQTSKYSKGIWE